MRDAKLEAGSIEDFFSFFDGKKHIISLVGGGGKSTLLEHLARRFAARRMRTAVITTTRMACPAHVCADLEACRLCWEKGEYAACGERTENGKFRAPRDELLEALIRETDVLLVEADGAHMRACKAPAEHEPVILPESDIVIGVMGVEVLGKAIQDVCHRPQHVCALLGCSGDHRLTAQDMADIFVSEQGTRKHVGARDYYTVINKCDDEARRQDGKAILLALAQRGQKNALLTSFCAQE